ncbi:hypothetical protein IC608_09055 [Devosia sp. PTR5]|uniref:Uncharacterized protein n=1 Tax=Devosia oryzisoli TaxID=2774138 RepID=A0A927FVJ1_9HYPH|nr:hypothetical protein [Devosia oryzisoli]MBD8065623.1 hypothetical protein [Devosia oryzisoli]
MNKNTLMAVVVAVVVIVVAAVAFTSLNQAPTGGTGPTSDENLAPSVPEPGAEPTSN